MRNALKFVQSKKDFLNRPKKFKIDPRQFILEKAMELFLKHGYANTSMEKLAKDLNMSVGWLYKHFADKKELIAVCAQHAFKESLSIAEEIINSKLSPEKKLRNLIIARIKKCNEYLNNYKYAKEIIEVLRLEHQELYKEMIDIHNQKLALILAEGKGKEIFNVNSPEEAAKIYFEAFTAFFPPACYGQDTSEIVKRANKVADMLEVGLVKK